MPQFLFDSDTITVRVNEQDGRRLMLFEPAGPEMASKIRDLPLGGLSFDETGRQAGFDLMVVA